MANACGLVTGWVKLSLNPLTTGTYYSAGFISADCRSPAVLAVSGLDSLAIKGEHAAVFFVVVVAAAVAVWFDVMRLRFNIYYILYCILLYKGRDKKYPCPV